MVGEFFSGDETWNFTVSVEIPSISFLSMVRTQRLEFATIVFCYKTVNKTYSNICYFCQEVHFYV